MMKSWLARPPLGWLVAGLIIVAMVAAVIGSAAFWALAFLPLAGQRACDRAWEWLWNLVMEEPVI